MHNIAITPTPAQTRGERYRCKRKRSLRSRSAACTTERLSHEIDRVETADLIRSGEGRIPVGVMASILGCFRGFLSTAGDAQKRSTSWASRCIAAGSRQSCKPTAEERSAGKPHATFCGNRRWATVSGDPVGGQ